MLSRFRSGSLRLIFSWAKSTDFHHGKLVILHFYSGNGKKSNAINKQRGGLIFQPPRSVLGKSWGGGKALFAVVIQRFPVPSIWPCNAPPPPPYRAPSSLFTLAREKVSSRVSGFCVKWEKMREKDSCEQKQRRKRFWSFVQKARKLSRRKAESRRNYRCRYIIVTEMLKTNF